MIRPANISDLPAIMELSRQFYDEMNFDEVGYRFDPEVIKGSYMNGMAFPERFILRVAEHNGNVAGIIFCAIQDRTMYFKDRKFAQEIVWHSDPNLHRFTRSRIQLELLKEVESTGIPFYLSTDLRKPEFEAVGRYLKKHGYIKMCEYFYKA